MPDVTTAGVRRWLLPALVLLLVLSVAALAWVVLVERNGSASETARENRDEVVAAVRDYAETAWTFSDDDLDAKDTLSGVVEQAEPVITPNFRPTYEQLIGQLAPVIAGKQVRRFVSEVTVAGVDSLEEDEAVVIADVDANRVPPKGKAQTARVLWVLTLKKIDGQWRVDEHEDLTAGSQGGGAR